MANAPGTGTRPSTSSGNTPHDHASNLDSTTATSEVTSMRNRVNVYDSDGSTTPTGTASTTPGEWRVTDDESRDRTSLRSDPAPAAATRSGASWVTTLIALIVIVLIAYFIMQLLF